MKEVFGVTVAGVYCTDRPETACNEALIPASGGPAGRSGYSGSELITQDGTIPCKILLRCLADPTVCFVAPRGAAESSFCFMSDALYIAHMH